MMQLIGWCSIGLLVSIVVGYGFTLGALIALKMAERDIKK